MSEKTNNRTIKIWVDGKEKEVEVICRYDTPLDDPHWGGIDLTNTTFIPDDNHWTNRRR